MTNRGETSGVVKLVVGTRARTLELEGDSGRLDKSFASAECDDIGGGEHARK